jgi:hypothetical protein
LTPLIPSSELSLALTKIIGRKAPKYRKLYTLICDGTLPAIRLGGRWFVQSQDLPTIVQILGLDQRQAA